ncbi:MAG: CIA30 family protein [Steroidobacteraceae bacterium]|nr:CIA30 family protein [Steroidobacteraceae bacterium]
MSLVALVVATTLLDFDAPADAALWRAVDDVVMGGVSRSGLEQAGPGIARFAGSVSLENSGGFASVRTPPRDWDAAGAQAFVLRVRGDGKTYKFTLRTSDGLDGIQYQQRFTTIAGEWADVRLPVSEFVATFRGRKVPFAPALDAARVRVLGLMISDKQAGPFELLVDRIAIER